MDFFRRNWIGALVGALLAIGLFFAGQYYGRKKSQPIEWLSQINGPIKFGPIRCANGKVLGEIWLDVNLTNGKWRVIRNDPGKWPSCN